MGDYTGYRVVECAGALAAIMSCLDCGSALFLDPHEGQNVIDLHDEWHSKSTSLDRSTGKVDDGYVKG